MFELENFKVSIVKDVPLELKGTEGIFKNDIPEAEILKSAFLISGILSFTF